MTFCVGDTAMKPPTDIINILQAQTFSQPYFALPTRETGKHPRIIKIILSHSWNDCYIQMRQRIKQFIRSCKYQRNNNWQHICPPNPAEPDWAQLKTRKTRGSHVIRYGKGTFSQKIQIKQVFSCRPDYMPRLQKTRQF